MTSEELLRLENIFIKLKNDNLPLEDIFKEFPQIERSLLEKWNNDFNGADKGPKGPQIWTIITEKTADGKYHSENTLNFNISELERAKLELWRYSTLWPENVSDDQKEYFNFIVTESNKAHRTMSKYFIDLKLVKLENNEYNITFKLNTNSKDVHNRALEAVHFYAQYLLNFSIHMSRLRALNTATPDKFNLGSDIMPFAIKRFRIINYKGIHETEISDIPIDTKWIFITGENSYGKTSILQALAIGLFGEKDNGRLLLEMNDQDVNKSAVIGVEFRANNINRINNIHDDSTFVPLKNLACYGPSRLQVQASQTKNEVSANSSITYSLFNPDGVLLNIEYYLVIWFLGKNSRFESVKELFLKMIPYLADIKIQGDEVLYIEQDPINGTVYGPLPFESLASGVRSVIAMVGDMTIRLFNSQEHITVPSELEGIVIIDELDLHWHPKLQRELPHTLSTLFPHIQFIATTHSVIPFLGAPKNSIFLKVKRSQLEGVQIERLNIDITNLLPNILLTSSLFDMENITQINNKDIGTVRTEDTEGEMKANDERMKRISQFQDSEREFPNDLFK